MRALIIGGVGGMGQGVARDLVKQDKVKQVILADLYPDPGRLSKSCVKVIKPCWSKWMSMTMRQWSRRLKRWMW